MKYTLEQIIKCWREAYGEDMETEYSGFIKELQKEDKWNIAKDQSVILIELKIEYEDRKALRHIRLEEEVAFIILVIMRVQCNVNEIGLRSLASEQSITSAEYTSQ